mmetsp:Transcript_446/g.1544  ORF Transcript_446/g.1544 Transcript_446/m.1544 type:complete len:256 (-) Transcript_446:202-969(-)
MNARCSPQQLSGRAKSANSRKNEAVAIIPRTVRAPGARELPGGGGGVQAEVQPRKNRGALEKGTAAALAALLLLLGPTLEGVLLPPLVDHADELEEDLLHARVCLGRGLDEAALELLRERSALLRRHDPLLLQIQLVADQHDGDILAILLDAEDLCAQLRRGFEAGRCCDAVCQHESLARLHVLVTERTVLLLSSGVHNIQHASGSVHLHQLPVRVLDGGVILLHEVALDEAHGESRLADSTSSNHNDSILCHGF